MKKIIFAVCIMMCAASVKALEPTLNYQKNIYSNRIGADNKIWSGQMAFIYMNNYIVYCIDPYLVVGNNYTHNSNYKIEKEDLEYYQVVAYYGYSNKRNNIYYYMAAQELIWERMIGKGNVFWTTGQYNTGERIDIKKYKKEIESDINNFYNRPSFHNSEIFVDSFSTISVQDKNEVLKNYKVVNSNAKIENNTLKLKKTSPNPEEVVFERILNNGLPVKVYVSSGSQTLAQFGTNVTIKSKVILSLDNYITDTYLRFYNSETNEQIEPLLCSDEKYTKNDKDYKLGNISEGEYEICLNDNLYKEKSLSFKIDKEDFKEKTYIDLYLTPVKEENIILEYTSELPNYNTSMYKDVEIVKQKIRKNEKKF